MKLLDRLFRLYDSGFRLFLIGVLVAAAAFGAFVMWTFFGELDASLVTRIGAALAGAATAAVIAWISWTLMKILN